MGFPRIGRRRWLMRTLTPGPFPRKRGRHAWTRKVPGPDRPRICRCGACIASWMRSCYEDVSGDFFLGKLQRPCGKCARCFWLFLYKIVYKILIYIIVHVCIHISYHIISCHIIYHISYIKYHISYIIYHISYHIIAHYVISYNIIIYIYIYIKYTICMHR